MVKLPENLEEDTIRKMLPGESGYTVPWAMYADENRDLYINGHYTISKKPGRTVHMYVTRTKTGVIVNERSIGDHKFSLGGNCFVGGSDELPVEKLV